MRLAPTASAADVAAHADQRCVADIVRRGSQMRGSAAALVFGDQRVAYKDLDDRSNRVANALRREGVEPGDRVAFLGRTCIEYFEVLFGAAKIGAVFCPVNWRLSAGEIAEVIEDAEPRILLAGDDPRPPEAVAPSVRVVELGSATAHSPYRKWRDEYSVADPSLQLDESSIAFQFYSSGTTGRPKGVLLSHANLSAALESCRALLQLKPSSVSLVASPLFHVAGGFWALRGLDAGATNVLTTDSGPAALVDLITAEGVTHAVLVPTVLSALTTRLMTEQATLPSLEMVVYGASPIASEALEAAMTTLGCRFMQAYGMTETSGGVVVLTPDDHAVARHDPGRLLAAGRPVPTAEVRIIDAGTTRDVLPPAVGEIVIRSPQNMVGYWRNGRATQEAFLPGGWLRTGDLGFVDHGGYLHVHDRLNDMIISGGENVYPAEVERVLRQHPSVAEAAVVGVPHDRWGETVKAIVELADAASVDEGELLAFTRSRLAHYKCPTSVSFTSSLPRNPAGKLLRRALREPYWAGRNRRVQ